MRDADIANLLVYVSIEFIEESCGFGHRSVVVRIARPLHLLENEAYVEEADVVVFEYPDDVGRNCVDGVHLEFGFLDCLFGEDVLEGGVGVLRGSSVFEYDGVSFDFIDFTGSDEHTWNG